MVQYIMFSRFLLYFEHCCVDPSMFWELALVSAAMIFFAMVLFLLSGPYYSLEEQAKNQAESITSEIEMKV